jgi:hypothetical protein
MDEGALGKVVHPKQLHHKSSNDGSQRWAFETIRETVARLDSHSQLKCLISGIHVIIFDSDYESLLVHSTVAIETETYTYWTSWPGDCNCREA